MSQSDVRSQAADQICQQPFVPNLVLKAAREALNFSQDEFAKAIRDAGIKLGEPNGCSKRTVQRWERGESTTCRPNFRRALQAFTGKNVAELGFTVDNAGPDGDAVDEVEVASAVLARSGDDAVTTRTRPPTVTPVAAVIGFGGSVDLGMSASDFVAGITAESPIPREIGWSEVEHVKATTRAVAMSENMFGGGLSCEAAIGQLRWAVGLLDATSNNGVRHAMFEAVGNLASVVAYSAFDIADYRSTDQCFKFALWCADQSGSWALRANTLAEMSRKAVYLGALDDALSLIEFAQVRSDRVSATGRAMMSAMRARLLAMLGRHNEAFAEVDRADTWFADRAFESDPPWLSYYDEAEHQGSIGRALMPVAHETRRLELVAPRLEAAIRLHHMNYPRSRTFSRIRLASLMMTIGDPREALPIGRQAITDTVSLRSKRIVKELYGLAQAAEQHSQIGDVMDLRHDITTLALPGI